MNRKQDNWILGQIDGLTGNPANPRALFSIGNLETLSDKENSKLQEEVKAFYNHYYSANNMRLALSGKQSIPELKALAEKYFSHIPNKNIPEPKITVAGLTQAEMSKVIRYQSIQDAKHIFVDFPVKNNKSQWRVKPNEYVRDLLTSEEPGTLCEQLRRQGLANLVTAEVNVDEYGADGYLRVSIDLTDAGLKNSDQVIAAVFAYVNLVKRSEPNELYFREAKMMGEKDFANVAKPDPMRQVINLAMDQFEYPVENLLNADFVYDHFDKNAIADVLKQLEPANARIWYISKNEIVDKAIPYFEGKYSIRDISAEEQSRWSNLEKNFAFNLPPLNTLFTDKPAAIVESIYLKPHQVVSRKGIEVFLTHPQFYREDKGILDIELNVPFAKKSAKNIVLSNLLSDIYKDQNTTLMDRAARASLKVNVARGATGSQFINISGYTTKHEELLEQMLAGFANLDITQKNFIESLDTYQQSLANAKKQPPFRQAFTHFSRLVNEVHWTNAELLAASEKLTLKDVVEYHKAVKADTLIRINAFGNYSEEAILRMAEVASKQLPGKRQPEQRVIGRYITPKIGETIQFKGGVDLEDNALVQGFIGTAKSFEVRAQLAVLNSILRNAFFSQLRTNEQLGYIVGSSETSVDEYPAFLLFVQSANTDLVAIKARMDRFRKEFLAELKAMDPAQIEQSKAAQLASILQKPTDFRAEADLYSGDFWIARYSFDSRDRYIAALEKVNKEGLVALYQQMLLNGQAANVLIQLKGTALANRPYAKP